MPSRWQVTLPGIDPTALPVEHLHAVVSGWFDTTTAEHQANAKPYTVTPPRAAPGGAVIEVALLDDTLTTRLHANTRAGSRHRFGHTWARLDQPPHLLGELAWHTPLPADATAWALRFLTPTTFRRGNNFTPNPSLRTIFGSLRSTWRNFAPPAAPPVVLDLADDPLRLTDIAVTSHVVRVNQRTVSGFTGLLRFTTDNTDPTFTAAVNRLVALAEYAGVGAYTTRGFGVTRPEPARHPQPRAATGAADRRAAHPDPAPTP